MILLILRSMQSLAWTQRDLRSESENIMWLCYNLQYQGKAELHVSLPWESSTPFVETVAIITAKTLTVY